MTTIIKDKHGKVLRIEPDTVYHADGTGPRDAAGRPIGAATNDADAGGDTTTAAPANTAGLTARED